MPVSPKPDAETLRASWTLVARLKDAEADDGWREFHHVYRRVILGVARKAGLRRDEADEVLQDSMWSVSKRIQEFAADPGDSSFRAWLLTRVRQRIVHHLRERRAVDHGSGWTEKAGGTRPLPRPEIENQVDLAALCEQEWEHHLLKKAMQQLQLEVRAEDYQIFHLLTEEHRSPKEVARMVGSIASQVYLVKLRLNRRIKRLLQRLREKLE